MSEKLKNQWRNDIMKHLAGRTITNVRYMTDEEVEHHGWYCAPVVIVLDNGHCLYPSRDDEGNDAGSIFTTFNDLPVIPVI